MAKSQQSFNKSEKEKKRLKKRKDKQERSDKRRAEAQIATESGIDNSIAYVDENGMLTDTPPDPSKKRKIKAEDIEIGVPKRVNEVYDPIRKGIVEFFNDTKGFGFIKDTENNEKYFVHVNGLIDDIVEGNAVTFELERGMKGMNAVRVKKS
jgi:cold shock CspA family protein